METYERLENEVILLDGSDVITDSKTDIENEEQQA